MIIYENDTTWTDETPTQLGIYWFCNIYEDKEPKLVNIISVSTYGIYIEIEGHINCPYQKKEGDLWTSPKKPEIPKDYIKYTQLEEKLE